MDRESINGRFVHNRSETALVGMQERFTVCPRPEQEAAVKDLRYIKTEEAIRQALTELLGTTPFEKISVRMISEKARIAKGTFYLHYEDKYKLARTLYQELEQNLEKLVEPVLNKTIEGKEKFNIETDSDLLKLVMEKASFYYKLETEGLSFDDTVRDVIVKVNYRKYILLGYEEETARLMAWQGANTVLDYCAYVNQTGKEVSLQDYWRGLNEIVRLTETAYSEESR